MCVHKYFTLLSNPPVNVCPDLHTPINVCPDLSISIYSIPHAPNPSKHWTFRNRFIASIRWVQKSSMSILKKALIILNVVLNTLIAHGRNAETIEHVFRRGLQLLGAGEEGGTVLLRHSKLLFYATRPASRMGTQASLHEGFLTTKKRLGTTKIKMAKQQRVRSQTHQTTKQH